MEQLEDRRLLATITVTSLVDNAFPDGNVTLREAVQAANTDTSVDGSIAGSGVDTILFDAALSGETITLGTELEIIQALTIDATALTNQLTIDANNTSRIFNITATSGDFTLAGLTLTGGRTTGDNSIISSDTTFSGGAVRSNTFGDLIIDQSTVSGNSTAGQRANGGGIFSNSALILTNSTVSGNNTAGIYAEGGGIFSGGATMLTHSTVSGNSTTGYSAVGGGIVSRGATMLTDSTVSGNSTTGYSADGGGIVTNVGVTLTNSTVSGNSTTGDHAIGGGISSSGTVTLTGSTVSGNSTAGYFSLGGGIRSNGTVALTNSTVSGNSTAGDRGFGGGILSSGTVALTSSTVTDNHAYYAGTTGGGIWNLNNTITITDSILAGNTAGGSSPDINPGTGIFTVNFSLLGTAVTPNAGGTGNLFTDTPLIGPLADNGGPTETHALLAGSLAIDAGDPGYDVVVTPTDQRGAPFARGAGLRVDIGAYEQQTLDPSFFVVTTATDELDYSNADVSLREAINSANGSIGADTISFDAALSGDTITLGGTELEIIDALTIDATALTDPVTIDANNTSRIFNITATTGDFTLAGLALTGGQLIGNNANFSDTTFSGGAVRSTTSGNLTIDQSTVSGNTTTGHRGKGGGIFSDGAVSLTNSTVSGNSTSSYFAYGGGIFAYDDVTLTDSTVSGNSTAGDLAGGGGIHSSGAVTLIGSTVSGNSTAGFRGQGGGIYSNGAVTFTDSSVSGNSTAGTYSYGGGIRSFGIVTLTSSTVSGNSTTGNYASGGGIRSDGIVTLTSSTVSGNSTAGLNAVGGGIFSNGAISLISSTVSGNSTTGDNADGGGIRNNNATITITNSVVAGNTASLGNPDIEPGSGIFTVNFSLLGTAVTPDAGGSGNLFNDTPLLGPLTDNGGPTETHALLTGSLAIDAGDPSILFDPTEFDQRGAPFVRVASGRIDIGAFEVLPLIVNSTGDSDDGDISNGTTTLREAISFANLRPGADTITFDIAGAGPHVISALSALPTITDSVMIDATSEPDYAGTPVVGIDGAAAGVAADGLKLENSGSTVKGLSIYNFGRDGIELNGDGSHTISQNWLGLQIDASAAANEYGLRVRASAGNTIDDNVISGNSKSGVLINGSGAGQNVLVNNLIGTDPNGKLQRANQGSGVQLQSPSNIIGQPGTGNTISGNSGSGISVSTNAEQTTIQANRIGTNSDGTADLGNGNFGVQLKTANNQVVGNLISGNQRHGILVSGTTATSNLVLGNQIGVDDAGKTAIPNGAYGVYVTGANGTIIGTTSTGEENLISGNAGSGIVIVNSTGSNVIGNKIGTTADGMSALGNGGNGISMFAGTTATKVQSNQIAGNAASAVSISGNKTTGNVITSNLIGVDANQTTTIVGGPFGILLKAPNNTVTGNTIAGATRGVVFSSVAATGNQVSGNFIGTDSTSTASLGMTTGVQFSQSAAGNTVGPDNVIANNGTGVRMIGSAGVGNQITQNSFLNNSIIGIDFANPGPTTNDTDDVDEGANRKQNHPELDSAIINGDNLDVTFSVPTAVANATYDLTIEVYKSDLSGQGQQVLDSLVYSAADAGIGTITRTMTGVAAAAGLLPGDFISATATDAAGNTSEFSAAVAIPGAAAAAPLAGGAGSRSALDVSADGNITALDALMVINGLGSQSEGESDAADRRGDVNGDSRVTALDALRIINWLSERNRDDSDTDELLFAAQVDEVFAADDENSLLSEAGMLF